MDCYNLMHPEISCCKWFEFKHLLVNVVSNAHRQLTEGVAQEDEKQGICKGKSMLVAKAVSECVQFSDAFAKQCATMQS